MTPVETTTLTSASFEELVKEILIRLDEDPAREGLVRTPHRVHRAFEFLTRGYKEDPDTMLKKALFTVSYDEMVIVKDEIFSRRLQIQERLTTQIAETIQKAIEPQGVGVVIEARHLCMMMRGVEKQHSAAVTSSMLGCFRDEQETRTEFLSLIRNKSNGI